MQFKKALVTITGGRADEEAVKLACSLAKKAKAKVYLIRVVEVGRDLPVDAEVEQELVSAEEALDRAEQIAASQDYEVETEVLQAREAGPAVVDLALERGAELIVMGMPYKRRFGEFYLGSFAPYVLENAPCRVLLCREPIAG